MLFKLGRCVDTVNIKVSHGQCGTVDIVLFKQSLSSFLYLWQTSGIIFKRVRDAAVRTSVIQLYIAFNQTI